MGKTQSMWLILGSAALTLTSLAAAGPLNARQRISITGKGDGHTFVLAALTAGPLRRDSGTFSDCCWTERVIMRDGQKIEINDPLATYTGGRGTLVVRFRVEWVNAGNGYVVGTGTWNIVRGTGDYAHITGGGRSAATWLPRGFVSERAEGYVRPR
jgi:hypothetical protein